MDYYSDVGLVLNKSGVEKLKSRLASQNRKTRRTVSKLLGIAKEYRYSRKTGAEMWLWRSVKWRRESANVHFLESFMQNLRSDDYYFIRLGFELDDVEEKGSFLFNPFNMGLTNNIRFMKSE